MAKQNPNDFPAADPSPEDEQTQALASDERLQAFGNTLAKTRDDWIRARAATGWDKRIAQDVDQYHSRDVASKMAANMMDSVQAGYPITSGPQGMANAQPHRSTVFVGVTRQKSNAQEARLGDILLPTDDRNWGIQPGPDPEAAAAMEDNGQLTDPATGQPVLMDKLGNVCEPGDPNGQPVPKKKIAQATQYVAHLAARAMQDRIDEQLGNSHYNAELRKVLHDAAVMGTGVIKGPVVAQRTRKAWRETKGLDGKTVHGLEIAEELEPASYATDPRMLWEDPACGDDVKNGAGMFELQLMTPRQVRELAKQPGFLVSQLKAVIEQGPKRSAAMTEVHLDVDGPNKSTSDKVFYHWTYWGELDAEDVKAAGVDVADATDGLGSFCGCVEMINDVVVRAYKNPLDAHPIPYDFFPWEKVSGSPRGYGVPYLMRSQQSVTNAAWRQMMDNSGVTCGPQIVIKQSSIEPVDGQWQLTPRKFWYAKDDNIDVTKAFASFEFSSHQAELAAIIKLAEELGDQETATPMMAQGQQGSAPDTVGGMQMLMNNANVVLRRLVKQFDDYITRPHITRYYDYNMLYSEDEEIKGDFNIDARGSSALIIRDIQNQAFLSLLQVASNPVFSPMIDPRELFTKALKAQHIDPADIMLTKEQVAANIANAPKPPPDPKIEVATILADSRKEAANAQAQASAAEVEARREAEVEDRKLRVLELQLTRDIAVMKQAETSKQTIAQVNSELAIATMQDRTRKELEAANLTFAAGNPQHHGVESVAPAK